MDRNLALEVVRVTEAAALAASVQVGRGDEKAADQVAVDAMRESLNSLYIDGTVVIGEGERDEAPMLFIGEKVGQGKGPKVDIALDPLEGTSITAKGGQNALAVVAMTEEGGFLNAPDTDAKGTDIADLTVCVLDRPRHDDIMRDIRAAGARIYLIGDGDVAGIIACAENDSGIDAYIGTGGAPEGVLAAAALQCIGGQMQGRLVFRSEEEKDQKCSRCGHSFHGHAIKIRNDTSHHGGT